MARLVKGAYMALGSPEPEHRNVPALLGEACWTLLADNMWVASPHRVTRLIRLPERRG